MASPAAEKIAAKHNADLVGDAPKAGHNSEGSVEHYAERLQNLREQQQELAEDVKELKSEAKDHEIDARALDAIVKRRMEPADKRAKRIAHEEKVDEYLHALGMI